MRIFKILVVAVICAVGISELKAQELNTKLDSAAYVIGHQFGEYYFLNLIEFNVEALHAGMKDGYSGNKSAVQDPQKTDVMRAFEEYIQGKQQEKAEKDSRFNKEVSKSILEQNRKDKSIKETPSGLQYQVIKEGKGVKPVASDRVKVHYVGTLYNQTVFDSSRDRNQPAVFGLTQVIPGWTEGLQLMNEGSTYKFWIPAELGYGDRGAGSIPPGSLLIFEVELIQVNPQD